MAVTSVDRGYDAMVKRVFGFGRPKVLSGIQEADGAEGKSAGEGGQEQQGLTVIDVAAWMEFGTDRVPARSFVRAWFDEHEREVRELLGKLMKSVVAGTRTKEQILEIVGQYCVGQMQARMARGIDPPLSPKTIARKGSSTPLVNTGQLRSSITYRVEDK
jgi:hypothetical protein